jgi:hypothetical protein
VIGITAQFYSCVEGTIAHVREFLARNYKLISPRGWRVGSLRQVLETVEVVRELLLGYANQLPHPFTIWFPEFLRKHEPVGL